MSDTKTFPFDITNIAPPGAKPIQTPMPPASAPVINPPGFQQTASIAPPPPAAETKKPKRKRGGKSSRRPEEDIPSENYLKELWKLGPRDGESIIAFRMRMASTEAGRIFILEAAKQYDSNIEHLCKQMGIQRYNLSFYLTRVGLSMADVRKFRHGHNK